MLEAEGSGQQPTQQPPPPPPMTTNQRMDQLEEAMGALTALLRQQGLQGVTPNRLESLVDPPPPPPPVAEPATTFSSKIVLAAEPNLFNRDKKKWKVW
jgi:hypothetical protein